MKNYKFGFIKNISGFCIMAAYFCLAYYMVWKLDLMQGLDIVMRYKAVAVVCVLYCIVFYAFLQFLEGLSVGKRRILDLIFGFFFSSLCVNVIAAIICCIFVAFPVGFMIGIVLIMVLVESIIGFCWIMGCHRVYEKLQFRKEAIFIYGSREDEGEYVRVNNTINKYFKISRSLDYLIGIDRTLEVIQESSVVFLGDIPVEYRNVILKFCMKRKIECYCIPKISDIYIQNSKVMQLNDKLLLRYPPLGIHDAGSIIKRSMDIVCALLMIVCFSPIMLVIAILIKAEDGGRILYRQERVTLDGQPFVMYKFRSMHDDAEKDGARLARKNDDRITNVGRVIRNLHFDELPQLVNVLRGEMSLVGPRPERQEFINEYKERIPEFPERLKVKAGLTGYAQVYGRYNTEPEDKIKYDLYYIYNYSFWLDVKLLILTVRILFQKENTEGVDENQRSAWKEKNSNRQG